MPGIPTSPSTVVITGPIGPGFSVTSLSMNGVRKVHFDLDHAVLSVQRQDPAFKDFDISAITTITVSIAADVATFTLS